MSWQPRLGRTSLFANVLTFIALYLLSAAPRSFAMLHHPDARLFNPNHETKPRYRAEFAPLGVGPPGSPSWELAGCYATVGRHPLFSFHLLFFAFHKSLPLSRSPFTRIFPFPLPFHKTPEFAAAVLTAGDACCVPWRAKCSIGCHWRRRRHYGCGYA